MKKFKARILSLVLTFMMVLSLAMGMEPMNIYAEVEPVKQSVEYDIFDLKVGDRLYDGDTVTDSSGVSNIRYCRYGMYADATNWENNVCN